MAATTIDAYMFFDGVSDSKIKIEGESTDSFANVTYNSFEISSFQWGASSSAEAAEQTRRMREREEFGEVGEEKRIRLGKGTSTGREINVSTATIEKVFDAASCALFMACTKEKCTFPKATVLFRKAGGQVTPDNPSGSFVFLRFDFTQVTIDSITWDISDETKETVIFNFEGCDIFYSPQAETGEKLAKFASKKKSAFYRRSTVEKGA